MLVFVVALEAETGPLKKRFRLKAAPSRRPFPSYSAEGVRLVVSGVGKMRAAAATSHLLTQLPDCNPIVVNLGWAGSASDSRELGMGYLVNRVQDLASGSSYYPDFLLRHPFEEAALTTVDRPADSSAAPPNQDLVDMEAAGFLDAALRFVESWQTVVFKIVSDYLTPSTQTPRLPNFDLEPLWDHCLALKQLSSELDYGLSRTEGRELDRVKHNLRLTHHQSNQLTQAALAYRCSGGSLTETLREFPHYSPENKREVKQLFERLLKQLHPTEL